MKELQTVNTIARSSITDIQRQELLEDFFSFLDVSTKTIETYRRALKQLFIFFHDNHITAPTREDIISFKKMLEDKNCKPSTISLYLAATKRFFKWTAQKNIYQNVAVDIKSPKQERGHKRDFLGASQIKSMLACFNRKTLAGKRDYAIMSLMAVGGLRTVEITRANVEDIRTLGDCTVLYVQGKGRKTKTEFVKLPAQVLEAINDYLKARGQVSPSAPLFAGIGNRNRNGRMTTRTISVMAKKAMRTAGYDTPRLTAHSLRHSAVTLALIGGIELSEVQAFARHSSISTTQIYAHNVDRIKSLCEAKICSMIF